MSLTSTNSESLTKNTSMYSPNLLSKEKKNGNLLSPFLQTSIIIKLSSFITGNLD